MDDTVGRGGGRPQAVEVVERAEVNLRPGGGHDSGGRVRTGEPHNVVPGAEEFGDDGRSDMAGCSGDEDSHEVTSRAYSSMSCVNL